jgi:3-oxoacyl-[acyl-carrier protein] reductase
VIALVTGASRGIGRACALELAGMGFEVWINYAKNAALAEQVCAEISTKGGQAKSLGFDVSDRAQVDRVLGPALEAAGGIDVLVNNAGVTKDGLMMWMPSADWDAVMAVSLDGFFNVTKAVLPKMLEKRQGRIVNMASVSGVIGTGGQVNYSAAKAGIIGATKALAKEVARRGVMVNCVAPGFINTDMIQGLPVKEIVKLIPMQEMGQPEDVASVVGFLCSPKCRYVTGQVIGVNGGVC